MRNDGRLCSRGENLPTVLGALYSGDEDASAGGRPAADAPLVGPGVWGRSGGGMPRPVSPAPLQIVKCSLFVRGMLSFPCLCVVRKCQWPCFWNVGFYFVESCARWAELRPRLGPEQDDAGCPKPAALPGSQPPASGHTRVCQHQV